MAAAGSKITAHNALSSPSVNGAITIDQALTVTGTLTSSGAQTVTGGVSEQQATLTLANGANTDIALPAASLVFVAGPTGAFSLNGLTGGVNGRRIKIVNLIAQAMTFTHQATSAAANQFTTLTGADVVTTTAGAAELVYDTGTSKWIVLYVTA